MAKPHLSLQRLNLSVDRNEERRAAFSSQRNLDQSGEAFREFVGLIPERKVHPARFQKEDCVTRLFPRQHFMRVSADADVRRDNHQVGFLGQRLHPNRVFRVAGKVVLEVNDAVLGLDHLVQAVGQLWGEMIVEEKLHAASACSNATASWTEVGWISNQRATTLTEPFAATLRAKMEVGTPSRKTIGWPKLLRGSSATK